MWKAAIGSAVAIVAMLVSATAVRHGMRWGARSAEIAARMTGDAYLEGGPPARLVMTRAISVDAPSQTVWAWLAQLGRGAGWYSIDRLDNGSKTSAQHIVSWIPEPQPGDATAIGYLRHLDAGRELVWWLCGETWLGATARMVADYRITPEGEGTRLVMRVSGDGTGLSARPAMWLFAIIDNIMARRQLQGIKQRAERYGTRASDPDRPETGARDQYQLYEVV